MADNRFDLVIRCGRVYCAANKIDGPGAVAIRGDRIIASGVQVDGAASQTVEFPDGVLLPGLVDFHAHPDRGRSRYGIDPDLHFLTQGVTTVMSQGDAGALNWSIYNEQVIQKSRTRVRLAINLSAHGEALPTRCFERMEDADVEACVAAIEESDDAIWGIAVNTSIAACGDLDPRQLLERALVAAERTNRPLLVGSRLDTDWPLGEQLAQLRSGDVLTYCFNGSPEGVVQNGQVRDVVWQARERGILFDIGHGMSSFSFPVAETALAQGFLPDTISTDHYRRHVGSVPAHNLPRTFSKLIAAGMTEEEAFVRITHRPAQLLGLDAEIGSLAPGSCADLVVLRPNNKALALKDTDGVERPGRCWEPLLTVRGGQIVAEAS